MRGTENLKAKVEDQKPHALQKIIMISQICGKAWTPEFLTSSPVDSVTSPSVRTTGVKEGGRKYTQDLGHHSCCH